MTQKPHVSRETASETARGVLREHAPWLTAAQLERLSLLVGLLCVTPVGVTAVRDPSEAAARHVLDALAGLPAVDAAEPGPLADVGSGGGLPGLVLATVRPQREMHLIEATGRKAAFIAQAASELGLCVHVHAARSEEVGRGVLRDHCACVVARALAPPPVAAELCLPLCRPGGRLVLWSRETAGEQLARAAAELGGEPRTAECPGVLVIGKVGPTPERFPRRPGMAVKRPLTARGSDRPHQ